MSKASRRKRRKRKQRRQSFQQEQQVAPPLPDMVPAKIVVDASAWAQSDGDVGSYIQTETRSTLDAYHSKPDLIERDANIEHSVARGGYAHRQLCELIQNSADSLIDSRGGRISLKLTDTHLYCADDGQAIGQKGVRALLLSHLSPKHDTDEIGRFGLGFKSVLGVTEAPEFFSRSGSFRFDRTEAENRIRSVVPSTGPCPTLTLAFPIDPLHEMERDADLRAYMGWATNIVRLPLLPGAFEDLAEQCETFRAEFLLLAKHVSHITIQTSADKRLIHVRREAGVHTLFDGTEQSRWKVYSTVHKLSDEARANRRNLDDGGNVSIDWAVPIDRKMQGEFWAFFPTLTTSLLDGILNAPWKTNEDRQNLREGVFNDELIGAAAELVADSIADLSSAEDPGLHLDILPRRPDGDNAHCNLLRDRLYGELAGRSIVPDQHGTLCQPDQLRYQPADLVVNRTFALETLAAWAAFEHRPTDWLHHSTLRRDRLARCGWLHAFAVRQDDESIEWNPDADKWTMPRVAVSTWLEALVQAAEGRELAVEASKVAIQTAVKVQDFLSDKGKQTLSNSALGAIVLTSADTFAKPDPEYLYLGGEGEAAGKFVHPELEQCADTLEALQRLGLKPFSDLKKFEETVSHALALWPVQMIENVDLENFKTTFDNTLSQLWIESRLLPSVEAANIIRHVAKQSYGTVGTIFRLHMISNTYSDSTTYTGPVLEKEYGDWTDTIDWREAVPVRTVKGEWAALAEVLLPGEIVPADGSRDASVAVDTEFHSTDLKLLELLGAVSIPVSERKLQPYRHYRFREESRATFMSRTTARIDIDSTPRRNRLNFRTKSCAGPLELLAKLSEEGRALYTWRLLELDTSYSNWVMAHDKQNKYGDVLFPSPVLDMLREFGMVRTSTGFATFAGAIDGAVTNSDIMKALMPHPRASQIRQVFDLQMDLMAEIEVVGEDEGVPIVDVWPALQHHLTPQELGLNLVRCEGFRCAHGSMAQVDMNCIRMDNSLYVTQQVNEAEELSIVLKELNKPWHQEFLEGILSELELIDVRNAVETVRQYKTDEERLLAAVGIEGLKRLLPKSLPPMLTGQQSSASGLELARAAIAKFHTGALKAYKDDIQHLNPPRMWAGSERAIRFVQSLGFDEEWAGYRNTKDDAYVEVIGPRSLPCLHLYQKTAVRSVRNLVSSNGKGPHRGMLSMPTGSGKTRVAVQALVESMQDDELQGGILWVADRDELCEQAVEAWQTVWASEGEEASTLRISRMWGGRPRPRPTGKRHVIVASIQTLHSRFTRQSEEYRFLSDFNLVVVDEAHGSIAPSHTSVLRELGLTRWLRDSETILLGLTATPYRNLDEEETRRLLLRYENNRLDHGVFPTRDSNEVIRILQTEGILAMADHATIDGGEFHLTDKELEDAKQTPWLPSSAEERIAQDEVRTRRIVNEYLHRVDPDWATLIFATSVEHAEIVAALLNLEGITARAVSGKTETLVRRQVVEEFRSGSVQVLVNYGVFREGFDAPKTRAIVVARPVYSPNLYFQMIGRGLRGWKNGGNERCLVLNVRDNIHNFGRDLAFSGLDWLWDE